MFIIITLPDTLPTLDVQNYTKEIKLYIYNYIYISYCTVYGMLCQFCLNMCFFLWTHLFVRTHVRKLWEICENHNLWESVFFFVRTHRLLEHKFVRTPLMWMSHWFLTHSLLKQKRWLCVRTCVSLWRFVSCLGECMGYCFI